ncbi:hypothetical protein DDZ13_03900 [Coraliomargarita sinensis]|uniref:Uncharacterized protein n=1 Tax=Coraliomargarita sinensis TaxID=2174842 RepID=A0A317ZHE7_9BACT|nr:hypothetical protein [Coraliomargarita sinensis]PXA05114.1 hypothetical protein DDZ13_03900 [Coraliomargarita sinensis]
MRSFLKPIVLPITLLSFAGCQLWAAHPSQGLWVGEVALNAVNEATGAVGDSNTYEFTDPAITTPTADTAYLRLIVHVNGAGQASLLKSVAVVEKSVAANGDIDVLLITDPTLYPNYPGIARRYATAFYDFGNTQAVTALNEIIDEAVARAVEDKNSSAADIETYINGFLDPIIEASDVSTAYLDSGTGASSFITDDFFTEAEVQQLAADVAGLIDSNSLTVADFAYSPGTPYGPLPPSATSSANFDVVMAAAVALRDNSVFSDTRSIEAIARLTESAANAVGSLDAGAELSEKVTAAEAAAIDAWHNAADVNQAYNRYLASEAYSSLPEFIVEIAVNAAITELGRTTDPAEIQQAIRDALILEDPVRDADSAAVALQSASLFGDPRAINALERLLGKTAESAAAQVLIDADPQALTEVVEATADNTFAAIQAAPVFATTPTAAYDQFVNSDDFSEAAALAASTAASEVAFQVGAGVSDDDQLEFFADRAVKRALIAVRNQVAGLPQDSVAFSGELVPGGTVETQFFLPALAPTNPFMHRLHPDHTEGIAITREVSLEVNPTSAASGLDRAAYGVSRITGTYREEIFGLHKPLGNSQDIGLKTEGSFTLNRISLVDTLNF